MEDKGTQNAVEGQGMTPKQVDTKLADLWGKTSYKSQEAYHIRQRLTTKRTYRGDEERLVVLEQELTALRAEAAPLEAQYNAKPWSRFFLVMSEGTGHIHSSMGCTTCYPTTQYAWLPEFSGGTEDQMVAHNGEAMCTICFPSAPVKVAAYGPSKTAQELATGKAARDAKKAKLAADRAAKAITNPDGSVLKVRNSAIYTVYEAKRGLVDALETLKVDETIRQIGNREYVAELKEAVPVLVAALAAKFNMTDASVLADAQKKADAKVKQYHR